MSDLMFFIQGLLGFFWSLIILPLLFLILIGLLIAGMVYFDISIPWWGALLIAFFLSAIINGFKAPQNK